MKLLLRVIALTSVMLIGAAPAALAQTDILGGVGEGDGTSLNLDAGVADVLIDVINVTDICRDDAGIHVNLNINTGAVDAGLSALLSRNGLGATAAYDAGELRDEVDGVSGGFLPVDEDTLNELDLGDDVENLDLTEEEVPFTVPGDAEGVLFQTSGDADDLIGDVLGSEIDTQGTLAFLFLFANEVPLCDDEEPKDPDPPCEEDCDDEEPKDPDPPCEEDCDGNGDDENGDDENGDDENGNGDGNGNGNGDNGNGDDNGDDDNGAMAEADLAATGASTVTLAVAALLLATVGGGLVWYNRSRQAGV